MSSGDETELSGSGLSAQARQRLDEELAVLRAQRRELGEGLDDQDGVGDRADDAETLRRYDDAAMIDDRITEIIRLLSTGRPPRTDDDALPDGTMVTLRYSDGSVESLRAVAITEEVPAGEEDGSLTLDSPLGRALAGHGPGEVVSYDTPAGNRRAEIVKIQRPE